MKQWNIGFMYGFGFGYSKDTITSHRSGFKTDIEYTVHTIFFLMFKIGWCVRKEKKK